VTLAVDSHETISAAATGGVAEVVIDVNVGLPRCGCDPSDAGRLADSARAQGLEVRGVMGYEGHIVGLKERAKRIDMIRPAMEALLAPMLTSVATWSPPAEPDLRHQHLGHRDPGRFLCVDGHSLRRARAPIPPGSPRRSDRHLGVPGLGRGRLRAEALAMDHGDPTVDGSKVWFCSDEHVTFEPADRSESATASA